jgi:hypothetical protein
VRAQETRSEQAKLIRHALGLPMKPDVDPSGGSLAVPVSDIIITLPESEQDSEEVRV